jgi:hypothetical protein
VTHKEERLVWTRSYLSHLLGLQNHLIIHSIDCLPPPLKITKEVSAPSHAGHVMAGLLKVFGRCGAIQAQTSDARCYCRNPQRLSTMKYREESNTNFKDSYAKRCGG